MKRLTEIYMFLTEVDPRIEALLAPDAPPLESPEEGFCMIRDRRTNSLFVMVESTLAGAEKMRTIAQTISDSSGKPVVLARFSAREDLWTLEPR